MEMSESKDFSYLENDKYLQKIYTYMYQTERQKCWIEISK